MLAAAFKNNLSENVLPDGQMYYNIASRILNDRLGTNYEMISEASEQIQKGLNTKAGLGLNAVKPELNQDRIDGLINRVSSEPFKNVSWLLDDPVINFSQSIVDDTIRKNADFYYQSGMRRSL